jgi:hypothetical protein
MFAKKLDDLAARKQVLILESDLQRGIIALEFAALRARADAARSQVRGLWPWLVGGSVLAGLLALRRWQPVARWMPAALAAWRWFKKSREPEN